MIEMTKNSKTLHSNVMIFTLSLLSFHWWLHARSYNNSFSFLLVRWCSDGNFFWIANKTKDKISSTHFVSKIKFSFLFLEIEMNDRNWLMSINLPVDSVTWFHFISHFYFCTKRHGEFGNLQNRSSRNGFSCFCYRNCYCGSKGNIWEYTNELLPCCTQPSPHSVGSDAKRIKKQLLLNILLQKAYFYRRKNLC